MQELILLPEEESIGERADKYLAVQLPQYSRSFFQKLFKDDQIQIQNTPIKASYRITGEEEIALTIPDAQKPDIVPENIPLDILYEDQDLLVVNKPKGMVVHPAHGHYSGTLVNALMYHCKDSLSGINGVLRPGIVHRIDMDTTGSLIVCKTDMAHKVIAAQLKEHSIHRCYRAIVHGVIKEDSGVIDAPIGRNPTDRKKMAINEQNGKRAVTHFKVLKRFRQFTYIECELETGRTHQIRVHMASLQHPLSEVSVVCNASSFSSVLSVVVSVSAELSVVLSDNSVLSVSDADSVVCDDADVRSVLVVPFSLIEQITPFLPISVPSLA